MYTGTLGVPNSTLVIILIHRVTHHSFIRRCGKFCPSGKPSSSSSSNTHFSLEKQTGKWWAQQAGGRNFYVCHLLSLHRDTVYRPQGFVTRFLARSLWLMDSGTTTAAIQPSERTSCLVFLLAHEDDGRAGSKIRYCRRLFLK